MDRLLTTHISYIDFLKDSTEVFSFNLLRFFILYSKSILHHPYIPSILLSRNTLTQHSPLYSLTHTTPFANYKYIIIQNLLLLWLNLNKHTFYAYGRILFIVYIPNILLEFWQVSKWVWKVESIEGRFESQSGIYLYMNHFPFCETEKYTDLSVDHFQNSTILPL